ncbi:hypothetical protein [Curtobacterium pusillum]|uniref:hypothetical protein n=1 Tax=Curtobacterium pusillum TaxID=69373 RepID=UPI0016438F77|nr:hypothetical protein [Curtobacterium pusillum]
MPEHMPSVELRSSGVTASAAPGVPALEQLAETPLNGTNIDDSRTKPVQPGAPIS